MYTPPSHIHVVNLSRVATPKDVAFWVEAVREQLGVAAYFWGWPPPGVFLYGRGVKLDGESSIIVIADGDGDPEAAGYHNALGGIVDMSQSRAPSAVLSHESLEMAGNWKLDRRFADRTGRLHAGELSDAVQRDTYTRPTTLLDETRDVELSNFLLPAWFDPEDNVGPYDFLGRLKAPFTCSPGGYDIAWEPTGESLLLAHAEGAHIPARKLTDWGRTYRLIASPF